MTQKEIQDLFSGKNEVELTKDVIEILLQTGEYTEKELKDLAFMGAKYNVKRNSFILPF
jgi:hypothetical protein